MGELWSVLAALATLVLPLALAWWLVGRPPRREPHGKMPPNDES